MRFCTFVLILVCFLAVSAKPQPSSQRIVGGQLTTIDQYPFQVALLDTVDLSWYAQSCGGTILNTRSILTAAHCFGYFDLNLDPRFYRVRVGSTFANSGGVIHTVAQNIVHPAYNILTTFDSDVAITRLATTISYNNFAQPGSIAGPNYNVADNQAVWATGWGRIDEFGPVSEQLRHVQIWTVNQQVCRQRYGGSIVSDNMLCSGWLDVGGRDQCTQDSGGPLIHNGVVIGVCSFGNGCASPIYPGINARVSRFSTWIQANA